MARIETAPARDGAHAPGTGVWVLRARPGAAPEYIAATIGEWNRMTRAYHVVPDADPQRPFFAGPSRITLRYAGEVAPGIVPDPAKR